ncbi:NAD(P)/FAD-dependent oxidoreductase [Algoriphagus persicinus]|uniref:NAD(P)/FAD-dependent oxidoreductase n=1 Tax=Algoriphagus persicinus TaxID=3108754 RepID=UPI002B3EE5F3|nr:NAD(P)/FAD-dependent oxidoreductase [Algoriphagus sp. E1-3-M2]MEB2786419.1 NAD(P)/FAD-dependent oxidoreductase [Algoriphagus sp. E1-3-M2]
MNIGIIGGGAAGFFAAIHASGAGRHITIFEKSPKLLSKVKVSGGGRCNVTHRPMEISKLVKNYPRGEKFLKKVFTKYKSEDTIHWFESRGVALKTEADGRMFPVSDSSQSIIDALLNEAQKLAISIRTSCGVNSITPLASQFKLDTIAGVFMVDKLIIASGGHPKLDSYAFLKNVDHSILDPIPSLFTFNTPKESIRELMGLAVADGIVKIEGTKMLYRGPVLVTHWGLSGPAVLKLSAFGAQWLKDKNYEATVLINWNGALGEEGYNSRIKSYQMAHPKRKVESNSLFEIPVRLWEHFCERSDVETGQLYGTLSKKQINKLVQNLFCYTLKVDGKTTFKEEFVTAGGIALNEVNPETMESKYYPNLYFAGEVLNIDGITGGFNFQAAWSTGFLAGISAFN